MDMMTRPAKSNDKDVVLKLLDEFRTDCIEQITGKPGLSNTARTGGTKVFDILLSRSDYHILLLIDSNSEVVGIITGYLCPMLRSGKMRAEVEEFYVKKKSRGNGNANMLMDAFIFWCKSHDVQKVNIESENDLRRAHGFYKKYGFEIKAQRFVKKLAN